MAGTGRRDRSLGNDELNSSDYDPGIFKMLNLQKATKNDLGVELEGLRVKYRTLWRKLIVEGEFVEKARKCVDLNKQAKIWLEERSDAFEKLASARRDMDTATKETEDLRKAVERMKTYLQQQRTGTPAGTRDDTGQQARFDQSDGTNMDGTQGPPEWEKDFQKKSVDWMELVYNSNATIEDIIRDCGLKEKMPGIVRVLYLQCILGISTVNKMNKVNVQLEKSVQAWSEEHQQMNTDNLSLQDKVRKTTTSHLKEQTMLENRINSLKSLNENWDVMVKADAVTIKQLRYENQQLQSLLQERENRPTSRGSAMDITQGAQNQNDGAHSGVRFQMPNSYRDRGYPSLIEQMNLRPGLGYLPQRSSTPMEADFAEESNPVTEAMNRSCKMIMDLNHQQLFTQLPPPGYDGVTRTFAVWKEDFVNHCRLQKLEDNLGKVAILRRALTGLAIQVLDCLPIDKRSNYEILMNELETRFTEKHNRWSAMNSLMLLKQGQKESVMEFATKMEKLGMEMLTLCAGLTDFHDTFMASLFSKGVLPQYFTKTKPNSEKPFKERVTLGRKAEADAEMNRDYKRETENQMQRYDKGRDITLENKIRAPTPAPTTVPSPIPPAGGGYRGSRPQYVTPEGYVERKMPLSLVGKPKFRVKNTVDKAANPSAMLCWLCEDFDGGPVYHLWYGACTAPTRLERFAAKTDQTGRGGYGTSAVQTQGAAAITQSLSVADQLKLCMISEVETTAIPKPIITLKFGPSHRMVDFPNVRVDSGADISVARLADVQAALRKLGNAVDREKAVQDEYFHSESADKSDMVIRGSVRLRISYGEYSVDHKLYVMENLSFSMLLGTDLVEGLGKYTNILRDFPMLLGTGDKRNRKALSIARHLCYELAAGEEGDESDEDMQSGDETEDSEGEEIPEEEEIANGEEKQQEDQGLKMNCITVRPVNILGRHAEIAVCKATENLVPLGISLVFKPDESIMAEMGLTCPMETLVKPNDCGNFRIPIRNFGCGSKKIKEGTTLGTLEEVDKVVWEEEPQAKKRKIDRGRDRQKKQTMKPKKKQRPKINVVHLSGTPDLLPREDKRLFDVKYPLGSKIRQDEVLRQVNLSHLTDRTRKKEIMEQWLRENADLFTLSDDEHGHCDLIYHKVDTGDSDPIRLPLRRTPLAMRGEVEQEIQRMLQLKVIRPSSSSWASPVVLIKKKSGELRFAIDFRAVNAITKQAAAILPRMDDLLDDFAGCNLYSALDMSRGFWQLPMDPETADRTGFCSCAGHFQFNCLPFGLVNAPQQFSQIMDIVFGGINSQLDHFAHWYIDDLAISSKTLDQHVEHLNKVAQRLRWSGLMLKPSKAQFMVKEVEYLGHLVNEEGVQPLPRKLEALRKFPTPTTPQEIKRFLGMCSFYRKWVPRFSTLAGPMTALLKKDVIFNWEVRGSTGLAFEALKGALTTPPILAFPDVERKWIVETDASDVGCGALLHQPDENGDLKLIACASKTFDQAERNYGVTDKETLAIVWALKFCRPWIYGSKQITVLTDHKASCSMLLGKGDISPKYHRWLDVIADFAPKIEYRKASLNAGADCLSRAPVNVRDVKPPLDKPDISHLFTYDPLIEATWAERKEEARRKEKKVLGSIGAVGNIKETASLKLGTVDMEQAAKVRENQLKDPIWCEVINNLEKDTETTSEGAQYWTTMEQKQQFCILDGVLYRIDEEGCPSGLRVVVPIQEKKALWEEVHAGTFGGHLGEKRIFGALRRDFWWPSMRADVVQWTKNCFRCAKHYPGHRVIPPMISIPIGSAMETICSDVLQLPITESGQKYAIVFQDMFTKWAMVVPVSGYTAKTTAKAFVRWCTLYQTPVQLLTDGGSNYTSEMFRTIAGVMGTKLLVTRPQHSRANGMAERFNKVLIAMLSRYADTATKWDEYAELVAFAYNITPHASTNYSPFEMLFGHTARLPTTRAMQRPRLITDCDVDDYQEELVSNLSQIWRIAKRYIEGAQETQKKYFDKKTKESKFVIGAKVFLFRPELA